MQEMQSSTNDTVVQGLIAYLLGITYQYNDDPHTPLDRFIIIISVFTYGC